MTTAGIEMKIFIDDAGAFNWQNPGISLFCGVTIPDRAFSAVLDRFARWRRSIIGHSNRELKGTELTEAQLRSFVTKVLPWRQRDIWLTVQGTDTQRTRKHHIERFREQASLIFERSSEICAENNNLRMKEQYRQMSGWVRSRSAENVHWIIGLQEAIVNSLQHTIVGFMEPDDDAEFRDLRIFIDESFVKKDEHINFWREWLRADLSKSSRAPATIPRTWRERSHPFIQSYSQYAGLMDLRHLFVENTGFFRSKDMPGLQIADICAHALYRYHRGTGAEDAYRGLRSHIACRGNSEMNMLLLNESSLHTDDPKNHAGILDIEEYKRRADELRAKDENNERPNEG